MLHTSLHNSPYPSPRAFFQRTRLTLWIALACFLLPSLALAQAPKAFDDFRTMPLGEDSIEIPFSELLANDADVVGATVGIVRDAIHGQSSIGPLAQPTTLYFTPDDSFWAVGSDLVVYEVTTTAGTSYAGVYLASEAPVYTQRVDLDFDDPNEPLPAGPDIAVGTTNPLIGTGSLRAQPASPNDNAYALIQIGTGQMNGGSGETDGCAGGFTSIPSDGSDDSGAAGYILLLGDESSTIHTAQARVGVTRGQGHLFVETRVSSVPGGFIRSALIDRGNDTVRYRVSYAHEDDRLQVLLQADGLAVRSPRVTLAEPSPTYIKIGFFQPENGTGSAPSMIFDDLTVGLTGPVDPYADSAMLFDPIQSADNFETGTLGAWTATHGPGLIQDGASSLSGHLGLGVTYFDANGPTFVSYQPPVGGPADFRFRKLTARAEVDLASFSIDAGRLMRPIEIRSEQSAVFGDTDFEIQVLVDAAAPAGFAVRPSFRQSDGNGGFVWIDGPKVPLETLSPRLELQAGRSDSDVANNGWLRLWVEGEIGSAIYGLVNDDQVLRTVHFGVKGFAPTSNASGTVRIDDAMVTR